MRIVLPAAIILVIGGLTPAALVAARPSLTLHGLASNAQISASELKDLRVRIVAPGVSADEVRARLDGEPLPVQDAGDGLKVDLQQVPDGRHTLDVRASSAFGLAQVQTSRRFAIDTKAPELRVPQQLWASSFTEPFTLQGETSGAQRVAVNGKQVALQGSSFATDIEKPPATANLTATDAAGNTARKSVSVGIKHPGMRAVHLSIYAWKSDSIRKPILDMIRAGKIDTVELDIKDEAGYIGYDSSVPLADKINTDKDYYDVEKVAKKLDAMGVRLVGRLVAFQDHVLAEKAWKAGNRKQVVQTPGGRPYSGGYGKFAFTNFANERVRQYNLAVEAAKLGFDGILFDYIRRPDGHLQDMTFPGIGGTTPTASITSFLKESTAAIHDNGAFVGVSVFGVAATRPKTVAQNIPQMAKYADYIAPMVYPSHWGSGEYGVSDPNSQPYEIVRRSLRDFKKSVKGTDATVIPWLQDFSLGVSYGASEVRAQIRATRDAGFDSFLLWDPKVSYTASALKSPD